MRDRHREADRHRGVHGVTALLEDGHADVCGDRLHGHDHPVPGAQAVSNKLIAPLQIYELNRSGAKLIAITPFEGGASQDDILLAFIPLFNRVV